MVLRFGLGGLEGLDRLHTIHSVRLDGLAACSHVLYQ